MMDWLVEHYDQIFAIILCLAMVTWLFVDLYLQTKRYRRD